MRESNNDRLADEWAAIEDLADHLEAVRSARDAANTLILALVSAELPAQAETVEHVRDGLASIASARIESFAG